MDNYIYIDGKKIEISEREAKRLRKEYDKKIYNIKEGDECYRLSATGVVGGFTYRKKRTTKTELSQGNLFMTKKAAEHERDKRKAIFKIKKYIYDNFGYDPTDWADWEDDTYKIEISYEYELYEFDFYYRNSSKSYSPIGYLKTEDQAQEIIKEFEKELKTIFNIR